MQLYAITDRKTLGDDTQQQNIRVLSLAEDWARAGVDFLQIREKDIDPGLLLLLASQIVETVRKAGGKTRVLVNGDTAIAARSGADGVHLPGGWEWDSIEAARRIWPNFGYKPEPIISVACHSVAEVAQARGAGATLAVFAPVFGKQTEPGRMLAGCGLAVLETACRAGNSLPVFALGGVTAENAGLCIAAGAAGIAGIRLFAGHDWTALRGVAGS